MASLPVLGYWNIRGLAQPIRLMLSYAEEQFEDKLYKYGPAPEYSRSDWTNVKFTLDLDFPNLPYYIDGDQKITQSLAIMRYLARKLELEPETEDEKMRSDIAEQQFADFRMGLARISYDPNFDTLKEVYLKNLPQALKLWSTFLGERKYFACQDKITHVDFIAYEALDVHRLLSPECLDAYDNLKSFMERFEALPTIAKYMKSDKFLKYPVNGDMARFASRSSKD
jgi:glutathione S-transferase